MIVSCGEALVDMVPDAVPGGGPMNVAIAAARQSAPAAFIGRVSTDQHGDAIWAHLEGNDVDLRACERGDEPTARAIVEHVPQLRFRFEGEGTADTCLQAADLTALGDAPKILNGGTLGLFRGRTAETLADAMERHDGLVSLDPNVRPQIIDDRDRWDHFHNRWVARADIYRGSDEDFDWIWPGRDTASIAEELLAGAASVVGYTRGREGATFFTRGGQVDVDGVATDVVDTVGAGDTFVATTLVGLLDHGFAADPTAVRTIDLDILFEIGRRAVAASAITCSRPGADPPRLDELDATL